MTEQLTGQTAIITGASTGIGAAVARELAKEGANVVLAARNEDKLAEVASSIDQKDKTLCVKTDMTSQADVNNLAERAKSAFGGVDIYVNNAGQMLEGTVTSGAVSEWEQMIDVNIKGTLYGAHSVIPDMLEKGSGNIINIASVSAFEVTKKSTVYSATKSAVQMITAGLEKELAKTGVRVCSIAPGMVDTDLSSGSAFDGNRKKLEAADIGRAVVYAVTQPDYVNVNEITVRPV